jgi:hypothetical protein
MLAPTGVTADTIRAILVAATSEEPTTVANIEIVSKSRGKKENMA